VRRRSRAEVEALVAEYAASGLSRKAFCAGRGLAVATLDVYRRRVRKAQLGDSVRDGVLLPVEVLDPGTKIGRPDKDTQTYGLTVLLVNGRRIEIGPGFDARVLEQIVSVLDRA
jgi:hypothetical protein